MPNRATKRWLGALLATGLLAAATVVGVGAMGYLGARQAAADAEQARAAALLDGLRREVIAAGALTNTACGSILTRLEPSGVTFVALLDPEGRPLR